MRNIILMLIFIIGFSSCSKLEERNEVLIGTFTEVLPINGRTQLVFKSNNQLTHRIVGLDLTTTFTIRLLNENELELSCNECDELPKIVSYRIINNDRFEIDGFFTAESSEVMIFIRS